MSMKTLSKTAIFAVLGLAARFWIAMIFMKSALTKVDGFSMKPSTFYLFENEYQLPFFSDKYPWHFFSSDFAAYMATFAEFVFPTLLVIGLLSRFSASALLGMTLVIQTFVYPSAYATHGLWAAVLLYIIIAGPGMISLDHLWKKIRGE